MAIKMTLTKKAQAYRVAYKAAFDKYVKANPGVDAGKGHLAAMKATRDLLV